MYEYRHRTYDTSTPSTIILYVYRLPSLYLRVSGPYEYEVVVAPCELEGVFPVHIATQASGCFLLLSHEFVVFPIRFGPFRQSQTFYSRQATGVGRVLLAMFPHTLREVRTQRKHPFSPPAVRIIAD